MRKPSKRINNPINLWRKVINFVWWPTFLTVLCIYMRKSLTIEAVVTFCFPNISTWQIFTVGVSVSILNGSQIVDRRKAWVNGNPFGLDWWILPRPKEIDKYLRTILGNTIQSGHKSGQNTRAFSWSFWLFPIEICECQRTACVAGIPFSINWFLNNKRQSSFCICRMPNKHMSHWSLFLVEQQVVCRRRVCKV